MFAGDVNHGVPEESGKRAVKNWGFRIWVQSLSGISRRNLVFRGKSRRQQKRYGREK